MLIRAERGKKTLQKQSEQSIPATFEQTESQYPNVKGRDCSLLYASSTAKLEEETVWSGNEITNVIKCGWATATVQWIVGLLPAEDKQMGDSVLMSTDGPNWACSTVTGETVFTHFEPNCFPVSPLNARNGWHKSTIHKLIMDTHYTVDGGGSFKTHTINSALGHTPISHMQTNPGLTPIWWNKLVKWQTFQFVSA